MSVISLLLKTYNRRTSAALIRMANKRAASGGKQPAAKKPAASSAQGRSSQKAASANGVKNQTVTDWSALDFNCKAEGKNGQPWDLKICSWNVDGLRACATKGGGSFLKHENPDIICLQETKVAEAKVPAEFLLDSHPHRYWLAAKKDGYAGVGLLSKEKPIDVTFGLESENHDDEGRLITAEYSTFYLLCVYVPNAGRGLVSLDKRMDWDPKFREYAKKLDSKKPVIICGDLNVAHKEIDLKNPKTNTKNAGFTKEEREGFGQLLSAGFIDSFRHFYPDKELAYTFWTYMMNCRAKNVGWRLDYVLVSERLVDNLVDCIHRDQVFGSDHCPITLLLQRP